MKLLVFSRAAAIAFGISVLTLATVPAQRAVAQETTPQGTTPLTIASGEPTGLTLESQPAWTSIGSVVPIDLGIIDEYAGEQLKVIVHSAIATRTGFDRTVVGESLGGTLTRLAPIAVSDLPVVNGNRRLTLALQDAATPRDNTRVPITKTGVYPVVIAVQDPATGSERARIVTYIVAVPPGSTNTEVPQPLGVAWIWRMVAPPALLADGSPDPAITNQFAPNGRLGRIASALSSLGTVPITIVPGPETIEAWIAQTQQRPNLASGLAAIQEAATRNQVVRSPLVPIDIASLDAHDLGSEVGPYLSAGSDSLANSLGVRIDGRTAVVDTVDPGALSRLREAGVDRFVVSRESLEPAPTKLTPARPFNLESTTTSLTAAADESGLGELLATSAPPALVAQRFLAGLSVVALEKPGELRGIAIASSATWSPSTKLLDSITAGLTGHPLLRPLSLDTYFDEIPVATTTGGAPLVRKLTRLSGPTVPSVDEPTYRRYQRQQASFRSLLPADDQRIARGERALRVALSSAWTGEEGRQRAAAELNTIDIASQQFLSKIRAPDGRSVTITSETASVPITITNDTGQAVRVRVTITSKKLSFPEGSTQLVDLPPRTRTIEFKVRARASGTFPALINVTTADGMLEIQRTQLTVTSRVVSGVGVVLAVGAIAFLLLWWLNHFRKHKGGRRATPQTRPRRTFEPEGTPA